MKTRLTTPAPRKPVGRPTVRTSAVAERILAAVAKGVPFAHSVRLAGISYSNFCAWRNEDAAFRERLEAAISAGVEERLATIAESARTDWRAAEAWLRLVLPMEYSRNRIELSGPDGGPLAGGVNLYLPQKNGAAMVDVAPAARALTERSSDGNGH